MVSRKRQFSRALVALSLTLALVAAACGSSSKSGGSGDAAGTTVAAPTGTPLKIGWVGTITTANGVTPNQSKDTMDSWVSWTNTHGGLNGHPVEIAYADDKADPAVGLSAVKDLVENQHVIAIVGSADATHQTWAPYVLSKKMPVISGPLVDAVWFTNAMFYPVGGSVVTNIWGQMKSAAEAGNKKVAVVLCTESPACAQAQPLFTKNATDVGMQMVYNALASTTQASYTAECLAAKNAGAEAVANFTNVVVMVRDCSRQNFKPFWISADQGPGISLIKQQPDLGKAVGSSEQWNCLDTTIPETKNLNAALKVKHPEWLPGGKNADIATGGCTAWAASLAFTKAIANVAPAPTATVTSDDVIRGLSMFKGETLGGIAPPLTYSDGTKPNPQVTCTFLYKWDNLKLISVPGPAGLWTCNP
ncbi:MAG TPA: ABC transporter substrate-binding protein [Acidimicrobiales bacterium]|jgi:branched-chain amino acid transport system substrate-binding protein